MRRFVEFVATYEKTITSFSSVFIALFTIVLAIATGFLWRATQNLVRGAEDTSKRQLRAYISVDKLELRGFGTTEPMQPILHLKNSGQTPAHKITTRIMLTVLPFPLTGKFPDYNSPKGGESFLGPNCESEISIVAPRPLNIEEQAHVIQGDFAVYVSADIRYWDTFGKEERFMKYRGFYRGNGIVPSAGSVLQITQTGDDGNDGN